MAVCKSATVLPAAASTLPSAAYFVVVSALKAAATALSFAAAISLVANACVKSKPITFKAFELMFVIETLIVWFALAPIWKVNDFASSPSPVNKLFVLNSVVSLIRSISSDNAVYSLLIALRSSSLNVPFEL